MRGDRLRTLRIQSGHTQESLAELLGIGNRQIWRYENSESEPGGDVLVKIAQAFNVSVDYLLGLTDDPMPYFRIDNLSRMERVVLTALRRGEKLEAIKVIANDD